ncbi:MAG: SCO family protein [Candidatus Dadabacteria bacterium]|nr:SCO family protein [Candidatus Dadabacteria bacterium]
MKRRNVFKILIGILFLILIGWGIILYQIIDLKSKSDFYGSVYEREAPNFTLTGQNGSKVSLSNFKDKVVLLFFGYTYCPDICPMTLSVMNNVVNELGDQADKVQVLFVSIDPERDTQGKLKSYIPYYNESFIGLTGTLEEIDKVAVDYNIFYSKEEVDSSSDYLMGHNSSVLLITPNGEIFLRYPQNKMDPVSIAGDIKRIL